MAGEARIGERAAPSSSATGSALSHAPSARRPPAYTTSLAAGALSGLSVDLLFYPIDTLKTRLQSSQGFLKAGGFSGIYRGIGSVAVGSAPGAAVFFVSYEGLKPLLSSLSGTSSGEAAPGVHMGAASIAEVAACLIRVPTEVIKSRQQTSHYGIKASSLAAAQAVWRQTGLRGLYTGFAGTISREIPFTCIQFPLYEYLKLSIARSELLQGRQVERRTVDSDTDDERRQARLRSKDARSIPTWQAGLAGSVAGSIAAGLTTPLDVAKTRIMLGRVSSVREGDRLPFGTD